MGITELIVILGCCILGTGVLLAVINSSFDPLNLEKNEKPIVKLGYFMMYFGATIIIGVCVPIAILTLLK